MKGVSLFLLKDEMRGAGDLELTLTVSILKLGCWFVCLFRLFGVESEG